MVAAGKHGYAASDCIVIQRIRYAYIVFVRPLDVSAALYITHVLSFFTIGQLSSKLTER